MHVFEEMGHAIRSISLQAAVLGFFAMAGVSTAAEISLNEALDSAPAPEWSNVAGSQLFEPVVDAKAPGGSTAVATVGLYSGARLKTKVEGPGVLTFSVSDPSSLSPIVPATSVFSMKVAGTTKSVRDWPHLYINGEGEHDVELTFFASSGSRSVAVDEMKWIPAQTVTPGDGWVTETGVMPVAHSAGGKGNAPQILLQERGPAGDWIEKSFVGPGVLEWDGSVIGSYTVSGIFVSVDDVEVKLVDSAWTRQRISLPSGSHLVRFSMDRIPDVVRYEGLLRLSGLTYTSGQGPLAAAVDDSSLAWLESGEPGLLVSGNVTKDKSDAWKFSPRGTVRCINLSDRSLKVTGWFSPVKNPSWEMTTTWMPSRSFSQWNELSGKAYPDGEMADLVVIAESKGEKPLAEALDFTGEFVNSGWRGIVDANLSRDLNDVARSYLDKDVTNTMNRVVNGPAEVKFSWKRTGDGPLTFKVGTQFVQALATKGNWASMTVMVGEGSHLMGWDHKWGGIAAEEAFVDQLSVKQMPARTLSSVTCGDRELPIVSPLVTGENWKPFYYQESGVWNECAQVVGGGSPMRMSVDGPVTLSFKVKCKDPSAPVSGSDSSSGSGFTVINENTRTYIGSYLSVKVNGVEATRSLGAREPGWVTVSLALPEGRSEVSLDVISEYRYYYEPRDRYFPAASDRWVWLDDLVLRSTDVKFTSWASGKKLVAGKDLPRDDADGDGVPNFFEYAFGTDPLKASSAPPKITSGLIESRVPTGGGKSKVYGISVPFLPTNFTGQIMESTDMVNWSPTSCLWKTKSAATASPSPGSTNSSTHQAFEIPMSSDGRPRFYRMQLRSSD